jgi:AraC-like DNA-binding protein
MAQTPESKLAYLGFQLISPGRLLRPYVRSYWHFQRETALGAYHEEFMHPTGGYGIVFNFGDGLRLDGEAIGEPVFLDGTNTYSRKMGFIGRVELMGIRFYEGGAYPFLGVPLNELRNETGLLDALGRGELLNLQARLQEAKSLPARIDLLDEWLINRLRRGKEQHVLIPPSLTIVRQQKEALFIPKLAEELSISQRQLERLYQSQVGMSPKQYAQLLKVERARLALKQLNGQTTVRVAADLGYYDQSHFIREFQSVIGMTPYAYLKRSQQPAGAKGKT